MSKHLILALILLTASFSTVSVDAQTLAQGGRRTVAVTFDDLPVISLRRDLTTQTTITRKLLQAIKSLQVPAIGFVNENKLLTNGQRDKKRVALLQRWLDANLELGNHTFSHPDLHRTPLDTFNFEQRSRFARRNRRNGSGDCLVRFTTGLKPRCD